MSNGILFLDLVVGGDVGRTLALSSRGIILLQRPRYSWGCGGRGIPEFSVGLHGLISLGLSVLGLWPGMEQFLIKKEHKNGCFNFSNIFFMLIFNCFINDLPCLFARISKTIDGFYFGR